MSPNTRHRQSTAAVNLGLAANILLAALKTGVGIVGHSPALLADGINSTSDVAYGIVLAVFMRLAGRPADEDHPYGHRQMESIAALVVGSFVITTAVAIFWEAINTVYGLLAGRGEFGGAAISALWIALFTVILKLVLTLWTQKIGRQTENAAVVALAYDHRNDIWAAAGATLGIFLGRMGYPWVDPLAGALVALIILRTGIAILRESSADLMDTVPHDPLDRQIRSVLETIPEIEEVEEILAHRFGPYLVINLTICIDGSLSVAAGDEIASSAEHILYQEIEFLRRVHIHYHPVRPAARAH